MSKRKKHEEHEEHENHERWLVSYADMMTLLVAFFIMMFAMSQIDLEKFKKFQGGVATALNKPAPATPGGQGILAGGGRTGETNSAKSTVELSDAKLKHDQAVKRERKDLLKAQKQIEGALQAKGLKQAVQFTLDARGLHVAIVSDKVLFDLGSADLRPDGRKVLDIVARSIAGMPNMISVEGHTDNRPITGRYPSNWELSTGRASTVVRTISGRYGIKAHRISASGYADQRPIKSNSTEAGRARNRRVEIVLISTVDQPVVDSTPAVSPTPATDSETEEAPTMADEKTTTPEKKSKKKLFMIVGGALVLALGGGGFMFMKGGKAEASEEHAKEKEVVLGELIRLDPITLNLADGDRYLKVGISAQLQVIEGAEAGGGHGGGNDALEVHILDETIHVLGGMTYEQLTKEHGREKAKEKLLKALKKSSHDQVYEIYFTDFVAQ